MKERALEIYSGGHFARAVVRQLSLYGIPIGDVIDSLAAEAYNKLHVERAAIFFEELDKGHIELTLEMIQSEEFLFSLFAALKASLYTRQKEKVRFFAKLFAEHLTENQFSQADEYDDYLKILDELAFREIYILYRLKNYEDTAHLMEVDEDDEDKDDELKNGACALHNSLPTVSTSTEVERLRTMLSPVQTCPLKNELLTALAHLIETLPVEIEPVTLSAFDQVMELAIEQAGDGFINLGKVGRKNVINDLF